MRRREARGAGLEGVGWVGAVDCDAAAFVGSCLGTAGVGWDGDEMVDGDDDFCCAAKLLTLFSCCDGEAIL